MLKGRLLKDGDFLAPAEMTTSFFERGKGLLGKKSYEGALYLPSDRSIHTFGMRIPIDVAFLNKDHEVLKIMMLSPFRYGFGGKGSKSAIEAQAGSFLEWQLSVGDQISFSTNDV